MLRVIMDTNVYGLLVGEKEIGRISQSIIKDKDFIVYGVSFIRKELRDTPRTKKLGNLSTRNLLLSLYDNLTNERFLKDSYEVYDLARRFYESYREFGGIKNWDKSSIGIDFMVVACASLYKLDLVISDDSKTLLNKEAIKAYRYVCVREARWQPNFWRYSDLRRRYKF